MAHAFCSVGSLESQFFISILGSLSSLDTLWNSTFQCHSHRPPLSNILFMTFCSHIYSECLVVPCDHLYTSWVIITILDNELLNSLHNLFLQGDEGPL